ncbi:gephyrin-like molybdotransferase Glp [Pelagibius sp. Alg239-R121]|uniref:molybdopterin molybdotransferase MoeA n=1 Tax=Pelagibius sp. Alg239-R121 TaxID=2993448 RepID=UPI0024A748FC|nr:gephyrin-like molybdotransferase Glp [Pelagibius sp. Alg239-R121]
MLSVEDALSRVRAAFKPLPAETVSVSEALGRVLASDAVSRVTQPPHDVSAMDGYAVRAADVASVPVTLEIAARVPAGGSYDGEIQAGQAARIFTGAPLPHGSDSIVIQEDTDASEDQVTVKASAVQGNYVRPAGLDFRSGDVGLHAGQRLTARDVGFAAAMNLPWLAVRRRPRVAVLATGDEVVMPGDPKGPNQIVSSNGLSLSAFVTACGGQAINLGIAPDNRDALAAIAEGAAGADLLITSGGASVGDHDLVRAGLGDSGLEVDFWKIAMRPGKPLIFGQIGGTPMLGLPGNPVSSLVCAVLFVRTALDCLLGITEDALALESAILGSNLPANDRRQDYLRAKISLDGEGRRMATPFGRQDSSMLATLARADCLIVRKPHDAALESGVTVDILPLSGKFSGI